jgi:hypothetical protein
VCAAALAVGPLCRFCTGTSSFPLDLHSIDQVQAVIEWGLLVFYLSSHTASSGFIKNRDIKKGSQTMVRFSASKSAKTAAVGVLTIGVLFAAPSAFAASSDVIQSVTGGAYSAAVTGPSLAEVATSHDAADNSAGTTLAVDDLTGTGAGWHVTEQVSDFAYTGANNGTDIPAAAFSVTAGTASSTNDASMTGVSVGAGGSLDTAKTVLSATAGNGVGAYSLANTATLTVPADARVGTYTATLTTSVVAGP